MAASGVGRMAKQILARVLDNYTQIYMQAVELGRTQSLTGHTSLRATSTQAGSGKIPVPAPNFARDCAS